MPAQQDSRRPPVDGVDGSAVTSGPTPGRLTAHTGSAYTRRQGEFSRSRKHAVLDQPLTGGRLLRDRGDALCRRFGDFWGLEDAPGHPVTCPTCITRAERYGVILADGTQPQAW